jgi:hypothetical protein
VAPVIFHTYLIDTASTTLVKTIRHLRLELFQAYRRAVVQLAFVLHIAVLQYGNERAK